MAWALQFNGNSYLKLPTDGFWYPSNEGEWEFETSITTPSDITTDQTVLEGQETGSRTWKLFLSGGNIGLLHQSNWSVGGFIQSNVTANTDYTVKVRFSGGVIRLYFNNIEVDSDSRSALSSGQPYLKAIGSFFSGGRIVKSGFRVKYVICRDLIDPTNDRNYNADNSAHGTGQPVLSDTMGANNATGVNFPTDGSAWVDLGGGAETPIDVTATEVLNSFLDTSSLDLTPNVALTTTEYASSFFDTSSLSLTEQVEVGATITEIFSNSQDFASISLSANASIQVTEQLQSFTDFSTISIPKEINTNIGEVLSPFSDESILKVPTAWAIKSIVATNYNTKQSATTTWTTKG